MNVRLKKLDMKKSNEHNHPDIKTDSKTQYLILLKGYEGEFEFYVGTFDMQWYGLNFLGWEGTGLQFDEPGTNSSSWLQIWEIQLTK